MKRLVLVALTSAAPLAAPDAQTLLSEAGGPFQSAQAGAALAFGSSSVTNGPVLIAGGPDCSFLAADGGWVGMFDADLNLVKSVVGPAGHRLGAALSTSGDLDADGWPDVLVGAPGGDRVHAYSGATLAPFPWSPIAAPIPGGEFGASVAIVADYDGDGHDDIAVGAPFDDTQGLNAGAVLIFRGSDGTGWTSGGPPVPQAIELAGSALARVADLDGDGKDDLAVGCPRFDDGGAVDVGRVTFQGTAQLVQAQLVGTEAGELFGSALAGGGDVNKDGRKDLVIGAPHFQGPLSTQAGRIEVRTGGAILAAPPLWAAFESDVYGKLGASVAFAGDVDHDGHGDVIAGAPDAELLGGRAVVWSGRTSEVLYDRRGVPDEHLGAAVAGGARIDGDVYDDWAVGRPDAGLAAPKSGAISIFSGKNHWLLPGPHGFGQSVAVTGDVDGDGRDDFAVGTYGGDPPPGRWTLLSGFDLQELYVEHGFSGSCPGYAVAAAGDVDGDGLADVLAGNPCSTTDDTVVLYVSADVTPVHAFKSPDGTPVGFGAALAGVGDVDGDGVPDVLVGDPTHGSTASTQQSGAAWLFSGAPPYDLLREHHGQPGDHLGHAVAAAGDVDLDGFPDYALGVPLQDDLLSEEGGAQVWSHAGGMLFAVGNTSAGNSHAGWSVAGVGDTNADGYADVAVGEPDWQGAIAAKLGRVRVYAGPAGAVDLTLDGSFPGSRFGWSVAPAGDVDADGHDDLAVGAPATPSIGGSVNVVSGDDGGLIHAVLPPTAGSDFGFALAGSLTPGVDLRFEVAVGSPGPQGEFAIDGLFHVIVAPFYAVAPVGESCTDDSSAGSYTIDMSPPFLGELVDVVVTIPPDPVQVLVLGAPLATPLQVSGCEIHVSPFAPYVLVPVVAFDTYTVEILAPENPAFAGVTLAAQAVGLGAKLSATHGLHFTFGY